MPVTVTQFTRKLNRHQDPDPNPSSFPKFSVHEGHSFYNGEAFENTRVHLKIPVPKNDFACYDVYDITETYRATGRKVTTILVLINNNSQDPSSGQISHILEANFLLRDVEGITSIEDSQLQVIVLNDFETDFNTNQAAIIRAAKDLVISSGPNAFQDACGGTPSITLPDEACGGVITKL